MKKLTLIMVAFSAIGFIASPVKADEANIQDARQESYIEGNYNTTIQETRQRIDQRRVRRGRSSVGNVQTSDQYSDVYGDDNFTRQRVRQSNHQRGRRNKNW